MHTLMHAHTAQMSVAPLPYGSRNRLPLAFLDSNLCRTLTAVSSYLTGARLGRGSGLESGLPNSIQCHSAQGRGTVLASG